MERQTCKECFKQFPDEKALMQHSKHKHKDRREERVETSSGMINFSGKKALIVTGLFIFAVSGFFAQSFLFGGHGGTITQPNQQPVSNNGHIAMGNSQPIGNAIGNIAPDFSVTTTEGESIQLSTLKGKPVVVEFVATWCPHCKNDLTSIKSAYPKFSDRVEFLAIGMDTREGIGTLSAWKNLNGYNVKMAPANTSMLRDYGVRYTTSRFIVDAEGKIVSKSSGEQSTSAWKSLFNSLVP